MRSRALPLLIVLLSACVSRPPSERPVPQPATAPAFDPVGTYEFNAEIMGQAQTGELRFTRQDGQLAGAIIVGGMTVELKNVKLVEARKLTASASPQGGGTEVQFTFTFEDNDKYTGAVTIPGMGDARLWGTRKKTE